MRDNGRDKIVKIIKEGFQDKTIKPSNDILLQIVISETGMQIVIPTSKK